MEINEIKHHLETCDEDFEDCCVRQDIEKIPFEEALDQLMRYGD